MASKKSGRLAGLAALGAAAYLYNKSKDKDKDKDAAKPEIKADIKNATASTDTDGGMSKAMLARGVEEGKKIDGSDLGVKGTTEIKDTEFGDLDGAMKAQANAPATPLTFGKAFREARNAGGKTFMFNGKSYTTELAKPAKPAAPAEPAEPAEPAGNKRGGVIKKMAKGGVTRADGCATKGHTKGRMV